MMRHLQPISLQAGDKGFPPGLSRKFAVWSLTGVCQEIEKPAWNPDEFELVADKRCR